MVLLLIRRGLWLLSFISLRAAGRVALALFGRPAHRGVVRPHELEAHRSATVSMETVDGERVVVYRWGDGARPVLFMHGWESRGSRFAPLVPALLDAGFSPIAFDAPGHGDAGGRGASMPLFAAIAAHIGKAAGPFDAIVAHSFGVPSAFYAVKNGVAASRIAGVAGPCRMDFLVEEVARRLSLRPSVTVELRRRIEIAFPLLDVWRRLSADDRPEAMPAPILLIHDTDDTSVRISEARLIKQAYGDQCELVVTSGLGHSRVLSDPDVVRRIVAFVAQWSPL